MGKLLDSENLREEIIVESGERKIDFSGCY
jgi:hypothetical protein